MYTALPFSDDLLRRPQLRLYGKVDDTMLASFLQQFDAALDASRLTLDELMEQIPDVDRYLTDRNALEVGLVKGTV